MFSYTSTSFFICKFVGLFFEVRNCKKIELLNR
jgi:hypothetical protein